MITPIQTTSHLKNSLTHGMADVAALSMGCSVTLKKLKVMRLLDLGERVVPGGDIACLPLFWYLCRS